MVVPAHMVNANDWTIRVLISVSFSGSVRKAHKCLSNVVEAMDDVFNICRWREAVPNSAVVCKDYPLRCDLGQFHESSFPRESDVLQGTYQTMHLMWCRHCEDIAQLTMLGILRAFVQIAASEDIAI